MSIFAKEHAGHASKALHTFPARNDARGISHVVTNAWPVAPRFVLPASILARNVACIVAAFLSAEAYAGLAWRNVNGNANIILVISFAMKLAAGLVVRNSAEKF